jgi:hypothetical protein
LERNDPTTDAPGHGERGVALLEAAIGLTLTALATAAALSAFVAAARGTDAAGDRFAALSLAQTLMEEAAAPNALAAAQSDGEAARMGRIDGFAWRIETAPHPGAPEDGPALLALTVSVAAEGAAEPLVRLRTLRAAP